MLVKYISNKLDNRRIPDTYMLLVINCSIICEFDIVLQNIPHLVKVRNQALHLSFIYTSMSQKYVG